MPRYGYFQPDNISTRMPPLPKLVFHILLYLELTTTGFAQVPVAHTLLWRITAKNGQPPSYLFGTMHLADKRLFNFDDSVYHAIEKSEGLAI